MQSFDAGLYRGLVPNLGISVRIKLVDHGLPLVALREQRLQLIRTLVGHKGPVDMGILGQLASVQSAIAACEAVIHDLEKAADQSQAA